MLPTRSKINESRKARNNTNLGNISTRYSLFLKINIPAHIAMTVIQIYSTNFKIVVDFS
jgi:hypothetical protein